MKPEKNADNSVMNVVYIHFEIINRLKFQNELMVKYFLTLSILLFCINLSFGQNDTTITIDDRIYSIIERYDNGQLKYIGQFNTTCTDETLRKHGYFIKFDINGNEIYKKLYFFDEERNRKVLGLKHGWWGWYGKTEKYFLGIRTTHPYIVDPCF